MSDKVVPMPRYFTYDRAMQNHMSPYAMYLIDCALDYEDIVLNGEQSRLDPECTADLFVMNTPAHGYAHMSVHVHETRDIEALRKLVGLLEEAKMEALHRILDIQAEEDET